MLQSGRTRAVLLCLLAVVTLSSLLAKEVVTQRPISGPLTTIAILVEFPDLAHKFSKEDIRRLVFETVSSYYREVSYGRAWLTGSTTEWMATSSASSVYSDDVSGRIRFIEDAIKLADEKVDFKEFQYVFIVSPRSGWAHAQPVNIATGDGVRVRQAALVRETTEDWRVYAHEMGHLIGLPDLYNPELRKGEKSDDMESWDLMSRGAVHLSAWSKIMLGWIGTQQILELGKGQILSIILNPVETNSRGTLVMRHQSTSADQKAQQYYLIEVRQRIGFDENLPDTGVLVIRSDEYVKKGLPTVVDADPSSIDRLDAFDVGAGENHIFIDEKNDFALILLYKKDLTYKLHITTREKAKIAIQIWSMIEESNSTIMKTAQNHQIEIDLVKELLKKAIDAYDSGDYEKIPTILKEAETELALSTKPRGYLQYMSNILMAVLIVAVLAVTIGVFVHRRRRSSI